MNRLWWAVLALAFWNPAKASTTMEYKLVVDSCVVGTSNVLVPPGTACNALTTKALSDMFVVLHSDPSTYEYVQSLGHFTVSNTGFEQIVLPSEGGLRRIFPTPGGSLLCAGDCDLKITVSDTSAPFLDAMFAVNTGRDTFFFSGDSGFLRSDFPSFGGDFTGHLQAVPEPSAAGLMIFASLALVVVRLARRHGATFRS